MYNDPGILFELRPVSVKEVTSAKVGKSQGLGRTELNLQTMVLPSVEFALF